MHLCSDQENLPQQCEINIPFQAFNESLFTLKYEEKAQEATSSSSLLMFYSINF